MKIETITRQKLIANEGMILTDGKTYGSEIFLAEGASTDAYYEITREEYEQILLEQEVVDEGGV